MRKSRSRRKTNNPNAGFTLIEAVLSIAILAIISVPLLSYFTDSMRYSSMMAKQQQATFLAQEITEGLLAENRLVLDVTDLKDGDNHTISGYTVPYLLDRKYHWDSTAPGADDFLDKGTGQVRFTSSLSVPVDAEDGYLVDVTITSDNGDLDNVQDLEDYRIDQDVDVVYIDSAENNQAVFELMAAHNTYCTGHSEEPLVDENTVMKAMSRKMYVHLTKETDGYRVRMWYEYECDKVRNANGTVPGIWNWNWNGSTADDRAVLLDKTVEDLQNIYLIYQWCDNGGDTVILSSDGSIDSSTDIDIGLYIIYQPRKDGDSGPEIGNTLKLEFDSSFPMGKVSGYTNAGGGTWIKDGRFDSTVTAPSVEAKSALMYEINTKVYPAGDDARANLLAEITAKKGE